MGSFIEELTQMIGPQVAQALQGSAGIEPDRAQTMFQQVAPLILAGLKKQMETGGPERVNHILNKYGSDEVLEKVPEVVQEKLQDPRPDPQLGGLLGQSGVQAARMLSKQFGLNQDTAMRLIPAFAPLVLGALTRKRDKEGAGLNGIASILDRDGDGSILDDVAGFFMNSFMGGGNQAATNAAGKILGGLLGSLFGRRS